MLAFEFLVLIAARSGEVRGMTWAEVDIETAAWTVPAGRIKADREHRVPLSTRALEVLTRARELSDGDGLVFPSATGKMISDSTMSKLCRENGINAVPHGFRSSFRDWASERTNAPHAITYILVRRESFNGTTPEGRKRIDHQHSRVQKRAGTT